MNVKTKEFLEKLDNLCKEYDIELSSSTDIDVHNSGRLIGYFPSVAKSKEFRDLDD